MSRNITYFTEKLTCFLSHLLENRSSVRIVELVFSESTINWDNKNKIKIDFAAFLMCFPEPVNKDWVWSFQRLNVLTLSLSALARLLSSLTFLKWGLKRFFRPLFEDEGPEESRRFGPEVSSAVFFSCVSIWIRKDTRGRREGNVCNVAIRFVKL